MTARSVVEAVTRQVIPPPDVRRWLLSCLVPTAAEVEAVRESVVILVIALALVVLIFGR